MLAICKMILLLIDQVIIGILSSVTIHKTGNSQIRENKDIVRTFGIFRTG